MLRNREVRRYELLRLNGKNGPMLLSNRPASYDIEPIEGFPVQAEGPIKASSLVNQVLTVHTQFILTGNTVSAPRVYNLK